MLKQSRNSDSYTQTVNKVIENIKKMGFSDIRADIDQYESPPRLISKSKEIEFAPDVMARKHESKGYFEISKKDSNINELINKWTALSRLATIKNGIFQIYVPHGHMKFTRELLKTHRIEADIRKL